MLHPEATNFSFKPPFYNIVDIIPPIKFMGTFEDLIRAPSCLYG